LKLALDELLLIVEKIDLDGTVVLFDQIDEYKSLNQDIKKITNFTSDILTDTQLLLNNKLAIGYWLLASVFGQNYVRN